MRKALCDLVGARRLKHPGDPAVGEQQDPVGVGRRHRIVRDHDHHVPVGVDYLAQQGEHLAPGADVQCSCRLVGEHHLRPGDECPGDRDPLLLAAGQLRGAIAQPLVQPDPGGDPRTAEGGGLRPPSRSGSAMFWATVSDGSRLKAWNTNPIRSRRKIVNRRSLRSARLVPLSATLPEVGRSSPAATLRKVLLPEPDGPMMAVNDPGEHAALTPSRATTVLSSLP